MRASVLPATRRLAVVIIVLVVLFAALLAVGLLGQPSGSLGSPADSRWHLVEDVFPPRQLTIKEINRGGPTCLEGRTLVVRPGSGCTFIVPKGVRLAVFHRVLASAGMFVTLTRTADLTQNVDTSLPGPDPRAPLTLRFAVHEGTTVTLSACRGPGSCRLEVDQ